MFLSPCFMYLIDFWYYYLHSILYKDTEASSLFAVSSRILQNYSSVNLTNEFAINFLWILLGDCIALLRHNVWCSLGPSQAFPSNNDTNDQTGVDQWCVGVRLYRFLRISC